MSFTEADFHRVPIERKLDMVHRYIINYKIEHDGISPTIRQVMEGLDISSTSVTSYYIKRLIDEGRLYHVRDESNTSGLGVTGGRWEYEEEPL